jgi:tetrahydromethanopterin S-methyltransferase subunit F
MERTMRVGIIFGLVLAVILAVILWKRGKPPVP